MTRRPIPWRRARRPSSPEVSISMTTTPTPSPSRACTPTPVPCTISCRGPSSSNSTEGEDHMDRVNRRGFLECMAWAGTGLVWTATGGVLSSRVLPAEAADTATSNFTFVQVSDTHVGFKGEANQDAAATLQQAVAKINALPTPPAFVIHTGDLTHGQKAGAFDTVGQILKGAKAERVFYIPGEHDVFLDGGKEYFGRFANGGPGWQSFDYKGVHFVALVNVLKYKGEKLGSVGADQIAWMKQDLAGLSSSTPVVVMAHVPLWAVYPPWGWTTEDAQQVTDLLTRFGSVTVLNGHIHQALQKVEGNVTFHTAMSTAFPQPAPGVGPGRGQEEVRGARGPPPAGFGGVPWWGGTAARGRLHHAYDQRNGRKCPGK